MLSRSHLLIERELASCIQKKLWGIEVSVINDNLYEWSARILGPPDSPWEGGVFRVYLKFDEHYNIRPPRICFHTIPYHPNVDMITGRPCIDYLDDWELWDSSVKISSILLQIQNLLKNPVLDEPINFEAASMIRNSYEAYVKIAHECVKYSQLLDSGEVGLENSRQYSLQDVPGVTRQLSADRVRDEKTVKRTTKLSFDDYYTQWSGMATTKPLPASANAYLESIKDKSEMMKIHLGMTDDELNEESYNKQIEYDNVYYGVLNPKRDNQGKRPDSNPKLARINRMKRIYLPKKPLPTPRSPSRHHSDSEGEADNLVAWTQNLNPDDLDII